MTRAEYAEYQQAVADFFEHEGIANLSSTSSEPFFFWRPCQCCGTALGGNREEANGYNPTTRNPSSTPTPMRSGVEGVRLVALVALPPPFRNTRRSVADAKTPQAWCQLPALNVVVVTAFTPLQEISTWAVVSVFSVQ